MKITFLGAAHEVTGSCTLLEVNGKLGLIDCGMEQGKDIFVNQPIPANAADLDFVLLTHAHIDHAGNLPLLYKNGFSGPVYTTEASANLCRIMLRDSAHIQESEAEYKTRKAQRRGLPPVEPLYGMKDAEGLLNLLRPCSYGEILPIAEGIRIRFTDMGHVLGSACIEVWCTEKNVTKKIVFSGDVGNLHQPILRDPCFVSEADYVVVESTYGERLHEEERPDYIGALAGFLQKTLDRVGNVVIPSFAVGRTQEMLYFIREIKNRGLVKGHDGFPVYVDSPLAEAATAVFLQADIQFLDEEAAALVRAGENPLWFEGLKTSVSAEESKAINLDPEPKVILSSSGMCDAGRIRHHLKHNLWRPESTVLFVGYQAPGTLGRRLVDGEKEVTLFGEKVANRAEIGILPGISGHADKNGLLRWMKGFEKKPALVFVNHGENEVTERFAAALKEELGLEALAPFSGTSYDLLAGQLLEAGEGIPVVKVSAPRMAETDRASDAYNKAKTAAQQLMSLITGRKDRSAQQLQALTADIRKLLEQYR